MKTIKDLYEFVELAIRNRKYPTSTAQGLRAAVELFDSELNDDERASLDKVKANLDQIYQSVFAKNKNLTAASLATYRSRLLKVINDFNRTIQQELLGTRPLRGQVSQERLNTWIHYYNHDRLHLGIALQTPNEVATKQAA